MRRSKLGARCRTPSSTGNPISLRQKNCRPSETGPACHVGNPFTLLWRANSAADPARYLWVRLFIRKNGYFRLTNLSYERDIPNLQDAVRELCAFRPLNQRHSTPENERTYILVEDSPTPTQGEIFASTSAVTLDALDAQRTLGRLALDQTHLEARRDVDELAHLLTLDELKALAKDFKVSPPKGKDSRAGSWTVRSSLCGCGD
jgi:hypothetical protein